MRPDVRRGSIYLGIHDTYGMRIVKSEARLGMYSPRLGKTLRQGPYDYDSVGDTRWFRLGRGFGITLEWFDPMDSGGIRCETAKLGGQQRIIHLRSVSSHHGCKRY